MTYQTLLGTVDFLESLRGKQANFLLSCAVTKTCEIEGLSQAGIPGNLHLTPTLDAEFVTTGEVRSLPEIASTPSGIPTPALITRAVHELHPFSSIELLDLGMSVKANINHFTTHALKIPSCGNIAQEGAVMDALEVFQKGVEFGQRYTTPAQYTLLAETIPAGTTTANATAQALGYDCKEYFSSSFKNVPITLRDEVIEKALNKAKTSEDLFTKLSLVSDNMIVFNAGFILGLQAQNHKLILAGGTQMASVLLVVNSVLKTMGGEINSDNLALCTTKWIAQDEHSNIKALLEMLDFKVNAYCANFDFSSSQSEVLKLYDKGEAKEGVGAGAALVYGMINGLNTHTIVQKIESYLG